MSAIRKSFTNASWQRCQVHFLRNIFSSIPKKNSKPFREAVKAIFKFTDIELARTAKNALVGEYIDQSKYTKACETLDNGFEDAFQYTVIGNGHNRLKSTNLLERLNQEVRRREKIIRIFPNRTSANRLIELSLWTFMTNGSVLQENILSLINERPVKHCIVFYTGLWT